MNFNSEKIGYMNSSAHDFLSKKYATFLTIHAKKWGQAFWLVQKFLIENPTKKQIPHVKWEKDMEPPEFFRVRNPD